MKNVSLFFFLLLGCLIVSCNSKNDNHLEDQFDFESFKIELQDNPDYHAYMHAKNTFLAQIENGEIELSSINNHLQNLGLTDFCSIDVELLAGFHGGHKYLEGFCNIKETALKLWGNNTDLKKLSEEQIEGLFYYTNSSSSDGASSREMSCLEQFNSVLNTNISNCNTQFDPLSDPGGNEICIEIGINGASNGYDHCCATSPGDVCYDNSPTEDPNNDNE